MVHDKLQRKLKVIGLSPSTAYVGTVMKLLITFFCTVTWLGKVAGNLGEI